MRTSVESPPRHGGALLRLVCRRIPNVESDLSGMLRRYLRIVREETTFEQFERSSTQSNCRCCGQ